MGRHLFGLAYGGHLNPLTDYWGEILEIGATPPVDIFPILKSVAFPLHSARYS